MVFSDPHHLSFIHVLFPLICLCWSRVSFETPLIQRLFGLTGGGGNNSHGLYISTEKHIKRESSVDQVYKWPTRIFPPHLERMRVLKGWEDSNCGLIEFRGRRNGVMMEVDIPQLHLGEWTVYIWMIMANERFSELLGKRWPTQGWYGKSMVVQWEFCSNYIRMSYCRMCRCTVGNRGRQHSECVMIFVWGVYQMRWFSELNPQIRCMTKVEEIVVKSLKSQCRANSKSE